MIFCKSETKLINKFRKTFAGKYLRGLANIANFLETKFRRLAKKKSIEIRESYSTQKLFARILISAKITLPCLIIALSSTPPDGNHSFSILMTPPVYFESPETICF